MTTDAGEPLASTRYVLAESQPVRPSVMKWFRTLVNGIKGEPPAEVSVETKVLDRATGSQIYRVITTSDAALQEARQSIARDLEQMTVGAFDREYGRST